jgi:GrpB-like predicted nucleotidyltransferase (UPF0157 family)
MVLGLEKSVVVLHPHNPLWIELGQQECTTVRLLLGKLALDVRHVGSTSVPGLEAKPILDVAAAVVDDATVEEVVERLTEKDDYSYEGDKGQDGGLLFARGRDSFRTVHVHVVGAGSPEWEYYLRFHDLLIGDSIARAAYQREKRLLAQQFPEDRMGYTKAKNPIIEGLLGIAPPDSPSH